MPESTDGRWNGVETAPGNVYAVHAILLHTGKVLLFSGVAESGGHPRESFEWDPKTDISTAEKADMPVDTDLFCCHHVNLEDGKVIAVGGSGEYSGGEYVGDQGIKAICIYDVSKSLANRWEKIGEMNQARWYPTLVTLPDGKLVTFSGFGSPGDISPTAELFTPPFKGPGYSTQTISGGEKTFPTYPGFLLVRGGKIVHCGPTWRYTSPADVPIGTFSFSKTGGTSGVWINEGTSPSVINREEGTFVLLPPAQDGKVLLLGGGYYDRGTGDHKTGSDLDSAEILDTQITPFNWNPISDMNRPRVNPTAVLLPDGKVLVIGGHDSYKGSSGLVASNQAEIYDRVLDTWTPVATMGTLRIYHSTALLLPDGKVLTAGGITPAFGADQQNMEFYEPPYFFNGPRPNIDGDISRADGPDNTIAYGGEFIINTPEARDIRKVALMRPGSITHHTDTEQRYVALSSFPISDNRLKVGVVNDPTVAPPGYYMLWIIDDQNRPCEEAHFVHLSRRHCRIITDRSHVSNDEVDETSATTFNDALYVILDGFPPDELGITTATPTQTELNALAPTLSFTSGSGEFLKEFPDIVAEPQELLLEDDTLPEGVKQKFTFKFRLRFNNNTPFLDTEGNPIELQQIDISGEANNYTCRAQLTLTNQPNPYMVDGETHWLSIDLKVFQINAGESRFGQTIGSDGSSSLNFIESVLSDFNTNLSTGNTQFNGISTDQATSKLELARSKNGTRVFNFAIAKVRYRGRTLDAENVRVFFRMFTTAATGLDYRVGSTYRTTTNTNSEPIPLLGIRGGEVVTIPFFAEQRVNTAINSMNEQRDINNLQTINATGGTDTTVFFGCWLDFNQTALRYPINPGGNGPFTSGLKSIQELIRGRHQCLVAEIYFEPDPINEGDTPASNDNLSQRNLAIVESENPGSKATHTVQHTFEIKANEAVGIGTIAKAPEFVVIGGERKDHTETNLFRLEHDELMIQWGNLPRNAQATLFIPDIEAKEIRYLTSLKIGPERIEVIDDHTLELLVSDVTYITLPPAPTSSIPALLSIELPEDVKQGQQFNISIMQISGIERKILGAFEFVIPVSSADAILQEEERTLSVFKHIANSIPANNHWKSIFERRLNQISERVRGLGGKPELITPSPDGDGKLIDESDIKLSALCNIIGIVLSILLGICITSLGFGSLILGGISLSALVLIFYYWKKQCKVSSDIIVRFLILGLLVVLTLLQFLS